MTGSSDKGAMANSSGLIPSTEDVEGSLVLGGCANLEFQMGARKRTSTWKWKPLLKFLIATFFLTFYCTAHPSTESRLQTPDS